MSAAGAESHVLTIIPARGGSRGIPRKNIRPIAGKPLLAYSIEHALATPAVTRTVGIPPGYPDSARLVTGDCIRAD